MFLCLQEREEIASIDLRRMTDFKGPEQGVGYEASCTFSIVLPDRYVYVKKALYIRYIAVSVLAGIYVVINVFCRTYQFRADSPVEADSWIMALKHTQVQCVPLSL